MDVARSAAAGGAVLGPAAAGVGDAVGAAAAGYATAACGDMAWAGRLGVCAVAA